MKKYVLSTLSTIGEIIKCRYTDNYLYIDIEPHIGYVGTAAFNTISTLNPTSVDIVSSSNCIYVRLKVKI